MSRFLNKQSLTRLFGDFNYSFRGSWRGNMKKRPAVLSIFPNNPGTILLSAVRAVSAVRNAIKYSPTLDKINYSPLIVPSSIIPKQTHFPAARRVAHTGTTRRLPANFQEIQQEFVIPSGKKQLIPLRGAVSYARKPRDRTKPSLCESCSSLFRL